MIAVACLALAVFSALYLGATFYLLYRDELRADGASQSAAIQESYEDRIAALRTEIDRITSRGLVDQANVEQKVDLLLDRQKALDARQAMLAHLSDAARKAGFDIQPVVVPGDSAAAASAEDPSEARAGQPIVHFDDMGLRSDASAAPSADDEVAARDRIAHIDDRLATLGGQQIAVVGGMAGTVAARANHIAAILKRLGRDVPEGDADAVGGPFVPLPPGADDAAFKAGVGTLASALDRLATLRRIALSLPLKPPLPNALVTSGFGPRLDPFLGQLAMHTGIDFRAPEGSAAKAVAAGVVVAADYNGGYGNMVDIDHGQGIITRYGHLSAIAVRVGDRVPADGIIGRIGSTGRATGPHLHYEIRVNGTAIDPVRYLRAGQDIVAWL